MVKGSKTYKQNSTTPCLSKPKSRNWGNNNNHYKSHKPILIGIIN